MAKLSIFILVLIVFFIGAAAPIPNMDFKNFNAKINSAPYTLVYVFSPSCGYCKEFTPKFEKLSNLPQLKELNVQLAKLDASQFGNLSTLHQVYAYPGLILFKKGIPYALHYRKDRQVKNIIQYLKKIVKPSYEDELLKYIGGMNHSHIVQYKLSHFFGKKDSKQFELWDMAVKRDGYISWAFTQSQQTKVIIGNHQIKQFDNFTQLQDNIKKIYAKLNDITEQSWLKMMEKKIFTIFYANKHGNKKTNQLLSRMAKEFYTVNFISIDEQHDQYAGALRQIGINDEQNIVAIDKLNGALYLAPSPYTQDGLRQFINKAKALQLQLYKKTQKTNKLNKLTRDNFQERMSTNQDVLLFLYDRKASISKELMSLFEFLLLKFKNNKHLLLLRCDVALNEVDDKFGYSMKPLPKIAYYRNRMKQTKHAIFFAESTISAKSMLQFIQQNATFDFQFQGGDL